MENTLITKSFALDKLIKDRFQGDVPFAIKSNGACLYNPEFNGGCAIGCLVPEMYEYTWEGIGSVRDLFGEYPQVANMFEDPTSVFWSNLQHAHDAAATSGIADEVVQLRLKLALDYL